ncbi:hypothetical protein SKAU_G00381960 [Synaphobranchus kaupii]|uniref:Uncharacterized protein n=1 Tax=Synaphobranchus kaupii TaxID=118154 RepID=A0A9Q1IES7_SYNKA|nr:hypothetical protein SKAU_G00381960 [Synaphobranchus kaupii]
MDNAGQQERPYSEGQKNGGGQSDLSEETAALSKCFPAADVIFTTIPLIPYLALNIPPALPNSIKFKAPEKPLMSFGWLGVKRFSCERFSVQLLLK